jgi:4-amino-4-deoxy-L-arabinose transferase-like glycosyltransferase
MSNKSSAFFKIEAPLIALVYKKEAFLKIIFSFAIISFLTTLNLPYQGEEGVYTITSLEMWYQNEWIKPFFYGGSYGRPPLFNWLIISLASFLGWEYVLVASRLIVASASIATAFMLFWLMQQLFNDKIHDKINYTINDKMNNKINNKKNDTTQDKTLAFLAAAIYLSGDLLFRRGWLAYADPLFAFFVFSAISFLWVALERKQIGFIALANLCLLGAFLSKAFTAYCFYGIAFAVLLWRHENRRFLLSPLSILFHLVLLCFPLVWHMATGEGAHGKEMMVDVVSKLSGNDAHLKNYLIKIISYPFSTLLYWMPASGVLVYLFWQNKRKQLPFLGNLKWDPAHLACLSIAFWILILNYIPYWLAPQNRIRYILPLYPFFALIAAYIIFKAGDRIIRITSIMLGMLLLVKFLLGFGGYSLIESKMRGDYLGTAHDILQKTAKFPLYVDDDSATGLSVTSQLNVLRLPEAPLTRCTERDAIVKKGGGFHIVNNPNGYPNTQVFQEYKLGRNKLYVLCEGKACKPAEARIQ